MGMERTVTFSGSTPSWEAIRTRLSAVGVPVSIRMIDGLPAFPDEEPEGNWQELRVSAPSGMITLRQTPGQIAVVVWGNADENLQRESDLVVQACTAAAHGILPV